MYFQTSLLCFYNQLKGKKSSKWKKKVIQLEQLSLSDVEKKQKVIFFGFI